MNKIKKLSLILLSTVSAIGLCCSVPLMTMYTKGEETPKVELDGPTDSSTGNTVSADYVTVPEDFTIDASTGSITGFSETGKLNITGKSNVKLMIPNQIGDVAVTEVSYLAWEEFCTRLEITDIDNTYNIPWNVWDGTANAFTISSGNISAISTAFKNKLEGKAEPILKNLIFPSPIKYYASNTFTQINEIQLKTKQIIRNNKNLESMLFSQGVTLIGQEAIKQNTTLKNLYFATGRKSVLYIDKQAFQQDTALDTIIFSAGVYLLQGGRAFQQVTSISNLLIASEGGVQNKNPYVPQFYITGSSGALYTNEYTYSDTVSASETYAISDNFNSYQQLVFVPSGFTEFDFPNAHTTEIGNHAFVGSQIAVLEIPDRITKIEQWAFRFADIKNIYLPTNATYGSKIFETTTSLTTIIAPSPQAYESLSKLDNRVTYEINVSYEVDGAVVKTDTILFGQNFYNFKKNAAGIYEEATYSLPTDSANWYFGKNSTTQENLEITSENLQSFFSGQLAGATYYSTDSSGVGILYKNITITNVPTEQATINKHVVAPVFQANVGEATYEDMPKLTVTFGYDGFNMNSLFSDYDANRMKYSISGTKALKLINGENRIFHIGEYVITVGISDAISEYTFSGTYNQDQIEEGVQSLQYRIVVNERIVNLPNDGNNILVSSEKELEAAIRLFENNYWYTATYSVVQADGTIRPLGAGELPQANGSYYVKLKLKDDDGNIKWCYGDGSTIIADNEEEINLLINTAPVVAKPILKGEVAGVTTTTIHFTGQRIPASDLFENYLVQALESSILFEGTEVEYLYNSSTSAYTVTVQPSASYNWAGEEEGTEAAKAPMVYTIYVSKAIVKLPTDVSLTVGSTDVPPFEYPISYENSLFYTVEGYSRTEDGEFNQELPMIGGLYFVRIILTDVTNSSWENGTTDPVVVKYTLSQKVAVPSINTAAGEDFFTYKAEAFRYENLLNNYVDAYTFDIAYQTIDGVSKPATEVRNAGIYTLTLSLYDGFTWETSFNGKLGPFTIYKKDVSVSGTGQLKESFGSGSAGIRTGLAANMGYLISGNLANDTDFGINISFTVTEAMLAVGNHTIPSSAITAELASAVTDNYTLTNSIEGATLIIENSVLDVHFSENKTHTYDGNAFHPGVSFVDFNTNQPLSLTKDVDYTLKYSQFLNGSWTEMTDEPIHSGTYKIIVEIVTTNYQLKDNIILEETFTIQQAAISVTGYSHQDGAYWIYDGTTTHQFPALFTGGVSGESLSISVSLSTPTANAGIYNTPTIELLYDEPSLQDYTISIADSANFQVTISKAGVKVGALSSLPYKKVGNYAEEDLGIQLVIENEATPATTAKVTYLGAELGTNLKDAKEYLLTLTLEDTVNYYFSSSIDNTTTFTFDSQTLTERKAASWTFTITKLEINGKVNPALSTTEYNGEEQEASILFKLNTTESNWGDIDSLSYTLEYYTDVNLTNKIDGQPVNVGIYYVRLFLTAPDANNYSLVLLNVLENRKFEITKRALEISSKAYQATFNNSNQFTGLSGLTINNLPAADTTTEITVNVTTESSNVGTYTTADGKLTYTFAGFDTNNYSVSLASGAQLQMEITPASVEISWKNSGTIIASNESTGYTGDDITENIEATYRTISGQENRLNIAITGQGSRLLDAGTYTLTASFGSGSGATANNYTLTNTTITFIITPHQITQFDLDALKWMNVNAGNRTLVGGTYEVETGGSTTQVTDINAFAKYRGTSNKIQISLPVDFPYNGIIISGYGNNEKTDKGAYTATATLTLANTNYEWASDVNANASEEAVLSKNWYIVDFTNGLKTDFSTAGWVYGQEAVYTTPELELGGTLTYKLRNRIDRMDQIDIENISDLSAYLNSSMPAGEWTLTICVPNYTGTIEGVEVEYEGREIEVAFVIEAANMDLINKAAINAQTFSHQYNGLPQYLKDVTPEIVLVEPTRVGGWADEAYDSHYSNVSDLALTYSNALNGTYHEESLNYWQGAPIRVNTYTVYYQITALNHKNYSNADNHFTVEITPKEIIPTLTSNHVDVSYSEGVLSWGYTHPFALTDLTITPDELYTVADGQGKGENNQDLVTFTHHFENEVGETVTVFNAGTYTLVIEVAAQAEAQNNNRNYTLGENGYEVSVLIKQMELEAPEDVSIAYTGQTIFYPVPTEALYEVESYSGEHTQVGTYTVTFKIKDSAADNYIWLDGKNTAQLEIVPATIQAVGTLPENLVYDGSTHEIHFAFTMNGETFVLTKGTDYTLTYSGENTGKTNSPIYADAYDVILELSNNFTFGTTTLPEGFTKTTNKRIDGSYTIAKARISLSLTETHEHFYNGTNYNEDGTFFSTHYRVVNAMTNGILPQENEFVVSYLGANGETELLDATTYTMSYTLSGLGAQNFVISNGDSDTLWKTTLVIKKAQVTFDLSDTSRAVVYTYNQQAQTVAITFRNLSGNTALPTHYEISYKLNSITSEFKNVGSYEVVVSLLAPDTKNFELTGTNPMVDMNPASLTANVSTSAVYKGAGQEPTISFTWQNGQSLSLTKNTQYTIQYEGTGLDENGLPKNVNEAGYKVVLTINDQNYNLTTTTYNFIITKAQITLGAGEYRYSGKTPSIQPRFVNADNPTVLPTSYTVAAYKTALDAEITEAEFVNVGTYHLILELTGTDADNFELLDDCYVATIIPETLASILWSNAGNTLPASTGTVGFNKTAYSITATGTFGDGSVRVPLNVEIVDGANQILNAGTYILQASVPNDNPNINAISGDIARYTLIVEKAVVELEVTDNEVEYAKEEQSATITLTGSVLPDSSEYSITYSAAGYSSNTGATDVNVYTITVAFLENGNYVFPENALEATDTFTITKAMVSFTLPDKTYNGKTQEATPSFTWKEGESITFTKDADYTISYEGNILPKDVNQSGYLVTITLKPDTAKNYELIDSQANMHILPKTITVTGDGVYTEVYGESGTTRTKSLAEVPNLALANVEPTDTVNGVLTFTLPGRDAKEYTNVNATVSLNGTSAHNYQLDSSSIEIKVNITKRQLVLSGTASHEEVYGNPLGASRTYTARELNLTLGNAVGNDAASLTINLSFTLPSVNVDRYTISNSAITFALADNSMASNYEIGQTNVSLSFEIQPAQIKAQFTGNQHTYSNTPYTPSIHLTYGTNNIYNAIPQDSEYTLSYQTKAGVSLESAPKNVGEYKTILTLPDNYVIEGTNSFEYAIEKCVVSLTGIQLTSGETAGWVYDGTIHSLEFDGAYTNFIASNDPKVKVTLTTPSANAQTYTNLTPQITWEDMDNYDVVVNESASFSLTIFKAELAIQTIPTSKPYIGYKENGNYYSEADLKEEITIQVTNSTVNAPNYTLTYKNGEEYKVLGSALSSVNTYHLKLELSDKNNFTFAQGGSLGGDIITYPEEVSRRTYALWDFEITKAQINAKIADSSKKIEYTSNQIVPEITFKHSEETVWGNEELKNDIEYALKYYTDSERTNELSSAPTSVGTYYVRIDFTRGNYELVLAEAINRVFEITPKNLTISADEAHPFTWIYNTSNTSSFTLGASTHGATISGVLGTDDVKVSVELTANAADAGTYKTIDNTLEAVFSLSGAQAGNYRIPLELGEFVLKITAAEATVVWELREDLREQLTDGYHFIYDGHGRINRIVPVITCEATGLSIEGTKEVKKNSIVVTTMIDAGTYVLTAQYSNSNYTLTNSVITIYVDPYTITADMLNQFVWVNRSASDRQLVSGTYLVDGENQTATNAFAKYRGTENVIEFNIVNEMLKNALAVAYQGNKGTEKGSYTATATFSLTSDNYQWDSGVSTTLTKNWYIVEFLNGLSTEFEVLVPWVYGNAVAPGVTYVVPVAMHGGELSYLLSSKERFTTSSFTDLSTWLNQSIPAGSYMLTVSVPEYHGTINEDGTEVEVTYEAFEVSFEFTVAKASMSVDIINGSTQSHTYDGNRHVLEAAPTVTLTNNQALSRIGGWNDSAYDSYYQEEAIVKFNTTNNNAYYALEDLHWSTAPISVNYVDGHKENYKVYYDVEALNYENYSSNQAESHYVFVDIQPREISLSFSGNNHVSFAGNTFTWTYDDSIQRGDFVITATNTIGSQALTYKYTIVNVSDSSEKFTGDTSLSFNRNNLPSQAGTYSMAVVLGNTTEDKNYVLDDSYSLQVKIDQKRISAPGNQTATYTGQVIPYSLSADAIYSIDTYSDTVLNVGTYTVTFKIKQEMERNYAWDTINTATLTVTALNLVAVIGNTEAVYYDRTEKSGVTISFRNATGETISVEASSYTIQYDGASALPRYAKDYEVTITLANTNYELTSVVATSGYTLKDSKTIQGVFTVHKARISIASIPLGEDHKHIYNGIDYNASNDFFTTHYTVSNLQSSGIIPVVFDGTNGYEVTYNGDTTIIDADTYTIKYALKGTAFDNFVIVDGNNELTEWTTTFEVEKAQIDISVTQEYIYTGNKQNVSITLTNQSGTNVIPQNPLTITYAKDTETDFLNAGSYTVTVTLNSLDQKNYNLVKSSLIVSMAKAELSVSASKNAYYNASNQEISLSFNSVERVPVHLTKDVDYKVTYSGKLSNGLPMDAGEYQVKIELLEFRSGNYTLTGETEVIFQILKARIGVSADGSYIYTGELQTVTPRFSNAENASVLPTQQPSITYFLNQVRTNFLNAGTYSIEVALAEEDEENFELINSIISVVMQKANIISVDWQNKDNLVYTGSVHNVTAIGVWGNNQEVALAVKVAGNKEILNADSYTLTASVANDNFENISVPNTITVTVSKAIVRLNVSNNNIEYTASKEHATIGFLGTTQPTSSDYSVLYTNEDYQDAEGAIDAGTYTLTVSLPQNGNFMFADGKNTASASFTIRPIELHAVIANSVYNGQPQNASIELRLSNGTLFPTTDFDYSVTYQGANLVNGLPKNAGRYPVLIQVTENKNYTVIVGNDTVFEITKALVSADVLESYSYTGEEQSVAVQFTNETIASVVPTQYQITYTKGNETRFLNAGEYFVDVILTEEDALNYRLVSSRFNTTMQKANIESIEWNGIENLVYTAKTHLVTAEGIYGENHSIPLVVRVQDEREILNAGAYVLEAILDNENFESLSQSISEKTIIVKPAIVSASVTDNHYTYDGEEKSATIKLAEEFAPEQFDVTYMLDEFTSTTGATNAGIYDIMISLEENGNFSFEEGYTTIAHLTIDPIMIGVHIEFDSYTGEPQKAQIEFNSLPASQTVGYRISLSERSSSLDFVEGTDYTVEYSGKGLVGGLPTNAGIYTVTITFISPNAKNYSIEGSIDGKFSKEFRIEKAKIEMFWSEEVEFADDAEIKTPYIYNGPWADMIIVIYKDAEGNILDAAPEVGGEYTVEVQLKDMNNFELSGELSKTFNIIAVSQADLTMYLWIIMFLLVIIVLLIIVIIILLKNRKNEPKQEVAPVEQKPIQEPIVEEQQEEVVAHDAPVAQEPEQTFEPEEIDDEEEEEDEEEETEETEKPSLSLEEIQAIIQSYRDKYFEEWDKHAKEELNERYDELMKGLAYYQRKPRMTFREKINKATPEVKAVFNAVKNEILQYQGVTNRLTKYYDAFYIGRHQIAKLSLTNKKVKVYLATDPEKYPLNSFPHKNLSEKKSHARTPYYTMAKSQLSIRRIGKVVADIMETYSKEKNPNYEPIDHAIKLRFMTQS